MLAMRHVLVTTIVLAAVPPSVVLASSDAVQYVGGTVKSIPVNSTGTFNFDDAKEFRFIYDGAMYKLPYDQITSTEIDKADVRRVWHVFPAMSPIASHRKQTLVINYTNAAGATGSVNFELPAYRAEDARDTIAAKKSPVSPAASAAASNEWWGDAFWKTTRNKPAWDAAEAQRAAAAQNAASTAQAGQVQPGQVQPGQVARGGN